MSFCDHVLVAQSCPALYDPMVCSPPGSSVHGILQARILEGVAVPFSRVSSWPRDQTHILRAHSLPSGPPGKPLRLCVFVPRLETSRVRILSLLQWIFPTQELYRGLLHCRRVLYQLSYEGSPYDIITQPRKIYKYIIHFGKPSLNIDSYFCWKYRIQVGFGVLGWYSLTWLWRVLAVALRPFDQTFSCRM